MQLQQVKAAVHDYALRMGISIQAATDYFAAEAVWLGAAGARLELEPADNKTGFSCVYRKGSKYKAQVVKRGFNVCLGTFVTPQEAALEVARHKAKEEAE